MIIHFVHPPLSTTKIMISHDFPPTSGTKELMLKAVGRHGQAFPGRLGCSHRFLSRLGLVIYGTCCKKTQIISQVFSNNFCCFCCLRWGAMSKFQIQPWFNCKNILKSMSRVWGQFALVWMQGWNSRALNAWRRNWSTNWCWLQPLDRFLQQWKSERFSLKNMMQSYLHYTHLYNHIYMLYLCACYSIWAEGRWRCSTAGIKRSR